VCHGRRPDSGGQPMRHTAGAGGADGLSLRFAQGRDVQVPACALRAVQLDPRSKRPQCGPHNRAHYRPGAAVTGAPARSRKLPPASPAERRKGPILRVVGPDAPDANPHGRVFGWLGAWPRSKRRRAESGPRRARKRGRVATVALTRSCSKKPVFVRGDLACRFYGNDREGTGRQPSIHGRT